VQLLPPQDRRSITVMTRLDGLVDLIIARGSEKMIKEVSANATVPVMGHGKGVCHLYIDKAAEIHADRSLSQRREALEGFKSGRYRVLVATDIASRGIDVKGIELVLNYDLPDDSENYVHRIGRTGRIGDKGHAISFATPDQGKDVKAIEKIMRAALPISEHPEMPLETFFAHSPTKVASFGGRSFGKGRRSRNFIAPAFRRQRR